MMALVVERQEAPRYDPSGVRARGDYDQLRMNSDEQTSHEATRAALAASPYARVVPARGTAVSILSIRELEIVRVALGIGRS